MAIKKDIDDMFLNKNKKSKTPAKKSSSAKKKDNSGIDNLSVDDIVTMSTEKKTVGIKSDTPKKLAPLQPKKNVVKKPEPLSPENKPKKRVVISGELPDYNALRAQELEKDKLEAERKAREEEERKAREEAERKAREEEERKAREEAERKAREEAERKAREAERKAREKAEREEAERKAREEAERKAREEAERKAREEAERKAREEAERKAREEAERKAREEAERKAREEAERKAREEAERKAREEVERRRLEAEEFTVEEISEINDIEEDDDYDYDDIDVDYDDDYDDDDSDPVGSLINNMREDAEKTVAGFEKSSYDDDDYDDYDDYDEEPGNDYDEDDDYESDEEEEEEVKESTGVEGFLEKVLDEDPEEIISERSEKSEPDSESKSDNKKSLYKLLGVIFAVFACVGFITVVSKGISMLSGYTSGNSKKNGFESVVYPVVIMDIESFESPAELPSDQVITAAIWSMIMSENTMSKYEMTFDVVKIPAIDVESYAVKLFGENIPELNHTTVGPAESRFYFNEETQSYNVSVAPVTYTYSPLIKGATKNGNNYTIVVEYMDELPEWLPETSSKSVEFKLTETNDGYTINSMKILSTKSNGSL